MKALALLFTVIAPLGAQITVESAKSDAPEIAVFGGDEAALRLRVESPGDGVTYDLLQIGGGLTAPLVSNQKLKLPAEATRSQAVEVRLPVPEVKGPTRMLVRFHAAKNASAQAFLDVFPRPASGQWRDALAKAEKSTDRQLAVFGESPHLREFFAKNDIAFRDLGSDFPENFPPDAIAIGEVTTTTLERHRPEPGAGRQIVFVEDRLVLPGIYESRGPEGALTKVTLPILAGLSSDPKSQTSFLDLLHHNLEPLTP